MKNKTIKWNKFESAICFCGAGIIQRIGYGDGKKEYTRQEALDFFAKYLDKEINLTHKGGRR